MTTDAPDPTGPHDALARAVDAHRRGDLSAARAGYEAVLARRPDHFDALHLLGAAIRQQGDAQGALTLLRRALALRPDAAAAHNHLGLALRDLGQTDEAVAAFRDALAHDVGLASAWTNLGATLRDRGDPAAALACLDRALAAGGDQAATRLNRANALRDLGRHEAALADCDRAVALAPASPDAWRVRGVVLRALGLAQAAVASHDAALALRPGDPGALIARGLALADLHALGDATRSIEQALAAAPDDPDAHWALARVRLAAGDYARGLEAFEWRWRTPQGRPFARAFERPRWDGTTPLDGRTVLLHAEQGLGDTIQFVRYAPMVRARGARVVLEVQAALAPLLARQGLADAVVARGPTRPAFDGHSPLMSQPRAFDTRIDTVPAPARYLSADPARVADWTARLGPRTRPRIGVVWSGAPTRLGVAERSVPLDTLAALLDEAFDWIALQHEVRDADREALAATPRLRGFGDALRPFDEVAAAMEAVDAVVGVDTALTHLAAALGRPTLVLLPERADWRWHEGRDDSPWYPSATLVRQHAHDRWEVALRRARLALHARFVAGL
ncbi:MAG: tetratricopeptide repeat protein [Burkholderiaceae bacterium]|nr:tetratricopeptide repeat protein [Burkholderiaceae bacterium]